LNNRIKNYQKNQGTHGTQQQQQGQHGYPFAPFIIPSNPMGKLFLVFREIIK